MLTQYFERKVERMKNDRYVWEKKKIGKNRFQTNRKLSIYCITWWVNLSRSATHNMLRDLKLKLYQIIVVTRVKSCKLMTLHTFCQWIKRFSHAAAHQFDKDYFGCKAWLYLDGCMNAHIYRLWDVENPYKFLQKYLLYSQKIYT